MLYTIQPLDPVAFKLGPIPVRWYGIIIVTGIIIAYFLAVREGKKRGIREEVFTDLLIWAVPIAILCARIYYVIFQWDYYSLYPEQIVQIWRGGLAIHGALIGAVATAAVFCYKRKIPFFKLADIAAPSLIIGQAIGRWGNFMNQEAYGGVVTREFLESLRLPDFIINQMYIDGQYRHPTFLYESLWNFFVFLLLILLRRTKVNQGEIFFAYLILYSVGRFFVEGMRTDSLMFFNLRAAQLVSVSLIVISAVLIFVRRRNKEIPRYSE
jgi:phosphatidylglycerol:prolipoprotein diacylglycerol transferase